MPACWHQAPKVSHIAHRLAIHISDAHIHHHYVGLDPADLHQPRHAGAGWIFTRFPTKLILPLLWEIPACLYPP